MKSIGKLIKNAVAAAAAFLILFAVAYLALYLSDKEDAAKTEWVKGVFVR